ncbi:MAG TPA: hypothetical protein VGQ39_03000 [Pyrinomonadaceae bacterium]|nr:hypothetical protein [Pyrinomonadaceae bacterium]
MRMILVLTLTLAFVSSALLQAQAQEPATQQPTAEDLAKQKEALEKNAYRLLEQVIDEAQALRLPENRVHIQIGAADLLWDHNQGRARSLFSLASDAIAEMMRTAPTNTNQRGTPNQDRRAFSLRQELVLAAARHDAPLAYQLLAATKSQTPIQNQPVDPRNPRPQINLDDNLEQTLLGRIAALDPKLAAQNAEQMMDKGQFPRSLGEVINQLQRQDAEAAAKLADKTVKRIQSANLLTNNEAGNLAQSFLAVGPRVPVASSSSASSDTKSQQPQGRSPVLEVSAYTDLLSTVIDSALKVTPQQQNTQRANQGGRPGGGGPNRGPNVQQQNNQPTPPTDAQIEQNNARRLLAGLQIVLPSIDLYLPGRASAVRQKLSEIGIADPTRANFAQAMNALQQGKPNADALVQAAATAPQPMQARIYQQAAMQALDEGNADRARQIANDHLQGGTRDSVMQRIDFREIAKKAEGTRLEEIRQNVARLSSDTDKVSLLLQIAGDLQKDNPKAQLQVLEEARQIINHRAASYDQFEDQLRVARAFAEVDPAKSFEVLEPGISQLNDLLSAAAVLSGFEVSIFRDGEMNVSNQGGSGLNSTINRYGQELALLARTDFERSETLAGRFQFAEPRIVARLSIIQGALGVRSFTQPNMNAFRSGGGSFTVRPQ